MFVFFLLFQFVTCSHFCFHSVFLIHFHIFLILHSPEIFLFILLNVFFNSTFISTFYALTIFSTPSLIHSAFQPYLSAALLFFIFLIAFLIMISVILSFLSLSLLVIFILQTLSVFPELSLTVLFSVGFDNISYISLKPGINIEFCCFFIFDSMRCFIL